MRNLALRISDADRTSAESRLRDACAEGRITPDELADRLDVVHAARTGADLEPLFRDLPRRREWFGVRRRYAAWWQRAAALVVDGATCVALSAVVPLVSLALPGGYGLWWPVLAGPVTLAYFTLLHGSKRGKTVGGYALEIAVRNENGGRASYGQAFTRALALLAFATFWFVGGVLDFLWPLWDRRCQAWHDKIAGTIVVKTKPD